MKIPAKDLQAGDKLLGGEVKDVVHLEGPPIPYQEFSDDGIVVAFGQRPAYSVVLLKLETLRGSDPTFIGKQQLVLVTVNDWMQGEAEVEAIRENHR